MAARSTKVVPRSPRVRCLTQDNPGIFTGPGTNTHLVGRQGIFILDPGQDDPAHFRSLIEVIGSSPVLGIVPTHSHRDHWPLAPHLARHFAAPTLGFQAMGGYHPERSVKNGELLRGPDVTLEAIHTPGHASDHLCYLLVEEKALFSGDHVMGWSTSVISPPDGDLNDYLASLERIRELDLEVMYPAHGPPIDDPRGRVEELLTHRRKRSEEVLRALDQGLTTIPALVAEIYAGVDPRLHAAAGQSLLAHLLALVKEGRVEVTQRDPDPRRCHYRLRDK